VHASTYRLPTLAVPLLLAVAVLGYLTGLHRTVTARSSVPPAAELRIASGSDVLLEYPVGWLQLSEDRPIPGLRLHHPLWLRSSGVGSPAGLEAGSLPGAAPSPLPPAILARLQALPQVEVVSLAALQALRYPDVQLAGYPERLELYAVPSPAGEEVVLACHAPAASASLLHQCEQIVASLSLAGQSTSDVTPDPVYAQRLAALIAGLDGARGQARATMSRAGDPGALARSSASLAAHFLLAVGSLARLEPPSVAGAAQVVLARSMVAAAGAYRRLSEAALAGSASGYGSARGQVGAAEQAVDGALENFALLGYGTRS
jgi:hypothetical protein